MVGALFVGPKDRPRPSYICIIHTHCLNSRVDMLCLAPRIQFGRIQRVVASRRGLIDRFSSSLRICQPPAPRARLHWQLDLVDACIAATENTYGHGHGNGHHVRTGTAAAAHGSCTWQIHRNRSLSLFRVCYSICTCTVLVPSETSSVAR